jgi:hypothetical protein
MLTLNTYTFELSRKQVTLLWLITKRILDNIMQLHSGKPMSNTIRFSIEKDEFDLLRKLVAQLD